MKLCQKCIVAIKQVAYLHIEEGIGHDDQIVPESECEFWAHIGLRAEHDWAVKLWAGLKEDV